MDELADIKLGVKTFLNPFFYVDSERIARFGIEDDRLEPVFRIEDMNREKFLQTASNTSSKIFICKDAVEDLVGSGAARYIRWAAKQRYGPKRGEPGGYWRDTPAATPGRHVWYQNQAMPPPARIAVLKLIDETFAPLVLDKHVRVDQSFNQINAKPSVDEDLLIALLSSTWFAMTLETYGRTSMGQGALQVPTETLRSMPVPDIRSLTTKDQVRWRRALTAVMKGSRLQAPKLKSSKSQRSLDSLVLESLGFDLIRLDELYSETIRMGDVRRNLAKGRTRIQRERFDTDLEEVARDMAEQLRPLIGVRQFPQDLLPDEVARFTVQVGSEAVKIRAEYMMGHRNVQIESAGITVFEAPLDESIAILLIRSLELNQRTIVLPKDNVVAIEILAELETLCHQLDTKLNELCSHAGAGHFLALRELTEAELNFPISKLIKPIGPVYEAGV